MQTTMAPVMLQFSSATCSSVQVSQHDETSIALHHHHHVFLPFLRKISLAKFPRRPTFQTAFLPVGEARRVTTVCTTVPSKKKHHSIHDHQRKITIFRVKITVRCNHTCILSAARGQPTLALAAGGSKILNTK